VTQRSEPERLALALSLGGDEAGYEGAASPVAEGLCPASAYAGGLHADSSGVPFIAVVKDQRYSDADAVQQILSLQDNERIISALWHFCYEGLLRRVLRKGLHIELAEDILQDVFALLSERLDDVRDPRIVGWLNTVADYECARHITMLRRGRSNRRASEQQAEFAEIVQQGDDIEARIDRRRRLIRTFEVLMELGDLDSFIVRASCLDGLPTETILDVIERRYGLSLTSVALYKRRSRIRRLLARNLREGKKQGIVRGCHD